MYSFLLAQLLILLGVACATGVQEQSVLVSPAAETAQLGTLPNRDVDALRQAWLRLDLDALLVNSVVYEVSGNEDHQGWWSLYGSHLGYAEDLSHQAPGLDRICEGALRDRKLRHLPYLTVTDPAKGQALFPADAIVRHATYRPHAVEETLLSDGIRADTLIAFEDTDRLWAQVRLSASIPRQLQLQVTVPDAPQEQSPHYVLYHNRPFDLLVTLPATPDSIEVDATPSQVFGFLATLLSSPEQADATVVASRAHLPVDLLDRQHTAMMAHLHRLPVPGPDPLRAQLYYRAFLTLENLRWAPVPVPDWPFGTREASLPQKPVYAGHWLWDGAFQALGYVLEDNQRAFDQLRILFDFQDQATGVVPNFIDLEGRSYADRSQPPVLAWVTWELFKQTRDQAFLREAYPHLAAFARWWEQYRDSNQDGLCGYGDTDPPQGGWNPKFESGWDTSPRWDLDCSSQDALDLNCWRVVQYRSLANMARELADHSAAEIWQASAEHLAQLVNTRLFDSDDGCYYDAFRADGLLNRTLTPASFFPLFAGIPDQQRAQQLVAGHLLDASRMWPALPSVAYDHGAYRPGDYWRGPTWINLAYVTIQGLQLYDFRTEADALQQHVLDAAFRDNHLGEYYNSQTGASIGKQGYGWTAAFIMRLILAL